MLGAGCLLALWQMPMNGVITSTLLLAGVGLMGASFPLIMAHARSFFPPHLTGQGVTLINLMGIGGVSLFQFISGKVYGATNEGATDAAAPYEVLFLMFALALIAGCCVYAFSRDRLD
jgi:nitrate/nitrite transporter NarK